MTTAAVFPLIAVPCVCAIARSLGTAVCHAGTLPAPITVVAFGDSTTAPRGNLVGYARLLQEELPAKGVTCTIVNAGCSTACIPTPKATASWQTCCSVRSPRS